MVNTPTGQVGPPESAHARRAQPGAAIELTTLTDGGQPAPQIAAEIATFLNHARTSLDLALYDVRLETEAGALVLATLLAAHQRGLRVRLLYNVDHPGPIPVPPPPETRPEAIEALPVETRGIAGIPDLMHHKFCVRDGRDVWTGSMNWTEDSWTRQENVVVRVLGAERLAFAFSLAFEELWQRGAVEGTGTVEPRPVELPDGSSVRPWFTPGHGEALSHRVAKHIGRARRRIRIASPVLTAGPILGTLVEVVNERRCTVVGVVDDTQVDDVFRQWSRNQVSAWKIPLLHTIVERGAFSGSRRPRGRPTASRTSCTRRSSSATTCPSSGRSTSRGPASGTQRTSSRSTTPPRRTARALRRGREGALSAGDAAGRARGRRRARGGGRPAARRQCRPMSTSCRSSRSRAR